MFRLLQNRQGMALLLTLLVVSVLAAVTVYFSVSMRTDYESAANLRDSVQLTARAGSVFEYGRTVLAVDAAANQYDTLSEGWASAESLSDGAGRLVGGGDCALQIVDQSGLLQVNALVNGEGQYNEALQQSFIRLLVSDGGVSEEDAWNITDAVKDWIDADDEVTRFGAESSTYLAMDPPYRCKNAPVETLAELLLVQGVSKELLYGSENSRGIASSLTPFGNDGTVNINTATRSVLLALSENMDEEMVESMDDYRHSPVNDLSSPLWYRNIRGDVDIDGAVVQSSYFEIVATAKKGRMRRTVRGAVHRSDAKKIEVLAWEVE